MYYVQVCLIVKIVFSTKILKKFPLLTHSILELFHVLYKLKPTFLASGNIGHAMIRDRV